MTSAVKSVILGTNVYDNVEVGMNLDMNFDQQKVEDYHYYVDDGQTQGYLDSRTESTSESTSWVPAVHRVPIPMMMIRPMSWKTVRSLPLRLRHYRGLSAERDDHDNGKGSRNDRSGQIFPDRCCTNRVIYTRTS